MADLAGAMAAIEDRLREQWTQTPISFENEADTFEPFDTVTGKPRPWVRCSIDMSGAEIRGVGKPGSHVVDDTGFIVLIVLTPVDRGRQTARELAVALGEVFRLQSLYRVEPGCEVRCWTPRVDRGEDVVAENPDGNWWAVTVSIRFVFTRLA